MHALFAPIESRGTSLAEKTANAIAGRIEAGELAPGQQLPPERTLITQLKVSRTVLREALRMLEANGLVEAQVGRGRFISERADADKSAGLVRNWLRSHRQDLEHLIEIRQAIECLALKQIRPEDRAAVVTKLRSVVADARGAIERHDSRQAGALDPVFHKILCSSTPNLPLQSLAFGLIDAGEQASLVIYGVESAARNSVSQHSRIVDLLERGDVEAAARELHEHHGKAFTVALAAQADERASR